MSPLIHQIVSTGRSQNDRVSMFLRILLRYKYIIQHGQKTSLFGEQESENMVGVTDG